MVTNDYLIIYDLIEREEPEELKEYLLSLGIEKREVIFKNLLIDLYRGNGWVVEELSNRFIIKKQKGDSPFLTIKTYATDEILTLDDVTEYMSVLHESSEDVNRDYVLATILGFEEEAFELEYFHYRLDDWDNIEFLIRSYKKRSARSIELLPHNQAAYREIWNAWRKTNRVAAVQATGTGKSFLILKCLFDFKDEKCLVLAPSSYILEQIEEDLGEIVEDITFMTYKRTLSLTDSEIEALNPALIVLDEFHRCGANQWNQGVHKILEKHENAKILGTSATPIRFLDHARNMAFELFDGNIASNLTLTDAIAKKILPMPVYVSTLYSLDEEINNLKEKLSKSYDEETQKKQLLKKINEINLRWSKTKGASKVIQKYTTPEYNKFIVFCKNKNHMVGMKKIVQEWFSAIGCYKQINLYRVSYDEKESHKEFQRFKNLSSNVGELHLLFAIDMLNEGIHLEDIDGVILLRPTISPIIFYQQIGRVLQAGIQKTPVIFDFVNNFTNIKGIEFASALKEAKKAENQKREKYGIPTTEMDITVFDETLEILEVFEKIESELRKSWDYRYEELNEYYTVNGNCLVPIKYEENPDLGMWVGSQRYMYNKGILEQDKIEKLNSLSFEWNPLEDEWRKMYEVLAAYKETNGNCNVKANSKEHKKLAAWVRTQRKRYKQNKLPIHQFAQLEELGFDWEPMMTEWESRYVELKEFRLEHGDCNVPQRYKNKGLASWVSTQRNRYSKGVLESDKIKKLEDVGFIWDPLEYTWNNRYAELKEYKVKSGHCRVPEGYEKNPKLSTWVAVQRRSFKKGILDESKIRKLEALDFDWDPLETQWEQRYLELADFLKTYGHLKLTGKNPDAKELVLWLSDQRKAYKKNKMNKERIDKLKTLNISWLKG